MNTALTHSRDIVRAPRNGAARAELTALVRHPAWQRLAMTGALASTGGIALLAAWALATGLGITGTQLPALFLVAGAILWMALAVDDGRPLVAGAATLNLAAMAAGAWALAAGQVTVVPLYGLHLLLVGLALLDTEAGRSAQARIWSGVELTALALMVIHL